MREFFSSQPTHPLTHPPTQKVMVLSAGNQMYFGEASGAEAWFSETLGYPRHHNTSAVDFIMDLGTSYPPTHPTYFFFIHPPTHPPTHTKPTVAHSNPLLLVFFSFSSTHPPTYLQEELSKLQAEYNQILSLLASFIHPPTHPPTHLPKQDELSKLQAEYNQILSLLASEADRLAKQASRWDKVAHRSRQEQFAIGG